jgi:hypothetical protein
MENGMNSGVIRRLAGLGVPAGLAEPERAINAGVSCGHLAWPMQNRPLNGSKRTELYASGAGSMAGCIVRT